LINILVTVDRSLPPRARCSFAKILFRYRVQNARQKSDCGFYRGCNAQVTLDCRRSVDGTTRHASGPFLFPSFSSLMV
jgi:hypothetical protein